MLPASMTTLKLQISYRTINVERPEDQLNRGPITEDIKKKAHEPGGRSGDVKPAVPTPMFGS